MKINDVVDGGYWPLRHHETDYDIGKRIIRKACEVALNVEQDGMFEVHKTVGDVTCAYMWDFEANTDRLEPGWAWAWPAVVTRAQDDEESGK